MNTGSQARRASRPILWAVMALAIVVTLWLLRSHIHFDWRTLGLQLRSVSPVHIVSGIVLIYISFWLRAVRWSILLQPLLTTGRKVTSTQLIASQLIGFTAVALIGRIADLSRPYLIAKRLKLPIASQLAIYSIERAFDLGAAAIIFSATLAFAPHDLPHRSNYIKAGVPALVLTIGIAIFAFTLRVAGETVARLIRTLVTPLSKDIAAKVAERVLEFREGLRTISSVREFVAASATSLLMWGCITTTYLLSARAFVDEPTLAHISFTAIMLVVAASLGGSLLQLPILGWFTQIAVNAAALHAFFNVPVETATACATVMLIALNLAIVPAGFIAARIQGTSLRDAVNESAAVSEQRAAGDPEAAPLP